MSAAAEAHRRTPRTAVLVLNLGTPDAPTAPAIRTYLREFLSDRRVVELPRLLWWPILNGIILTFRPRKLVHSYGSIWTDEGSPLLAISREQQRQIQERVGPDVRVYLAMRYGNPGVSEVMAQMQADGVRRVLVLPLYPQYSATTTASSFDAVFAQLMRTRWMPELRTISAYHDNPAYIGALADSVRRHWESNGRGEHLLVSFHSIPLRYFEAGDPYYCHCRKTARLLAEALSLSDTDWSISFQSRVGRAQWLSPYTDQHVVALAGRGVRRLDAICPGFAADCLETLEEVALRYGADFRAAGGEALRYVPALNAEPAHIDALSTLLRRNLDGWILPAEDSATVAERQARAAANPPDWARL